MAPTSTFVPSRSAHGPFLPYSCPTSAWRGGALASLRSLAAPALHGTPDRIWVDHEPTLEAVRAYLAGGLAPATAVDALVNCYRDNARKLAAFNSLHESPGRNPGT